MSDIPSWRRIVTDPAHLLSLARLPLAAAVWLRPSDPWFVVALLVIAAITDVLDGWIGRRTHAHASGTGNVGAWLDPICDKAFMLSAALAIAVSYHAPPLAIALLLARDVLTLVLAIVFRAAAAADTFHGHDFRARYSGKATTGAQLVTLIAAMFAPSYVMPLAIATALLGVVAVLQRVVLAWRDHRARSHSGSDDRAR